MKGWTHAVFISGVALVAATMHPAPVSAGTHVTGALPAELVGGFVPPDPRVLQNVRMARPEATRLLLGPLQGAKHDLH